MSFLSPLPSPPSPHSLLSLSPRAGREHELFRKLFRKYGERFHDTPSVTTQGAGHHPNHPNIALEGGEVGTTSGDDAGYESLGFESMGHVVTLPKRGRSTPNRQTEPSSPGRSGTSCGSVGSDDSAGSVSLPPPMLGEDGQELGVDEDEPDFCVLTMSQVRGWVVGG